MTTHHTFSFSGGKDSTALVLYGCEIADRKGFTPIIVAADTGHEHPMTYEYWDTVERHIGLPIRRVKQDFCARIEKKRKFISEQWPKDGVPADRVERALALLHPTGNPFLDLCLLKGRFPSTRARFCTEELKHIPIYEQVQLPLMKTGRLLSWQGVRADESASRAKAKPLEQGDGRIWHFRPILKWAVDDVFEMHRRHGLEPNPLYKLGFGRVGCMPCIMCRKSELALIASRFPEEVERVREWERLVSETCKRGLSSFFAHDKIPGEHQGQAGIPMPQIDEVVKWAKTSRGGWNYDLEALIPPATCTSIYGLCE